MHKSTVQTHDVALSTRMPKILSLYGPLFLVIGPLLIPSVTVNSLSQSQDSLEPLPVSTTRTLLADPTLEIENVLEGDDDFEYPTAMAFLGPNDILVAEKNTGHVYRVIDGEIQASSVHAVQVANKN